MQCVEVCCIVLQCVVVCCGVLQCVAACVDHLIEGKVFEVTLFCEEINTATHCNTLQHTATHCNRLRHLIS